MNLFQHYMGRQPYAPDSDYGQMRGTLQRPDMSAHTGGPGQMQQFNAQTGGGMQPMPNMHISTGLPAMAQGFPSAQTGGPGQMMPGGLQAGTGGYDAPQQFHAGTGGVMQPQPAGPPQAYTGGGFQPQQMNQGGNGLARMFRGFSPYGRQYMR